MAMTFLVSKKVDGDRTFLKFRQGGVVLYRMYRKTLSNKEINRILKTLSKNSYRLKERVKKGPLDV